MLYLDGAGKVINGDISGASVEYLILDKDLLSFENLGLKN